MNKIISIIVGISMIGTVLLTGCTSENSSRSSSATSDTNEDELDTVRLGVMAGTILSYVEAFEKEQGFFAANGIQLKISEFSAGINTVDSVTVDELDVGYVADFAIINRLGASESSNLRIFTTSSVSLSASTILYANTEKIKSLSDLEGASIITKIGTVNDYWNARILEEAGVDEDTVTILPIDGNMEGVAAMESGQADAMWASGETAENLLAIEGIEAIATVEDIDAYTLVLLVANEYFLEENSDLAERFIKALDEFYSYINEDTDRAAALIAENYNVPEDQILLEINQQLLEPAMSLENVETLESIYDWAVLNKVVSYEYDIRDYINTEALEALFPERVTYK